MLIKNVRLSFPHLFKASSFTVGQDEKYSATFILAPGDEQVNAIKAEIERIASEKWPKGIPSSVKVCLRPNSEKELDGFEEGGFFFNASNGSRPTVIDANRSPLVEGDGRPYAGCYVNAIIDFWAQDNQYGKRVNASLSGVQFVMDGDAFGGGRPASADDFPDLGDAPSQAGQSVAQQSAPPVEQKSVAASLFG